MDIQNNINDIKHIYDSILEYFDSEEAEIEDQYSNLIEIFTNQNILSKHDEILEIMIIISKISKNHHRKDQFFEKIERIISYFSKSLKEFFTNDQIFNLFKRNKRIILYLITEEIITINESILDIIFDKKYKDYPFYLFNEIKDKISKEKKEMIESEFCEKYPNVLENIDYYCKKGENDSHISELIRNDSCEEFISFINRSNISISSTIEKSLFETNSFLNHQNPYLIEYAAFFGSLQIFQYLRLSGAELTKFLWIYAIHGQNAEIIHLLEQDGIVPNDETYEECFNESIKCHHNEIAEYIKNNLLVQRHQNELIKIIPHDSEKQENKAKKIFQFFKKIFNKKEEKDNKEINGNEEDQNDVVVSSLKYHNYEYFPNDNDRIFLFKYFCEYNYLNIVKLFIQNKLIDINDLIVYQMQYFFYQVSIFTF